MGIKNISFYLDLKTLSSKGNEKLKEFAKNEELDVEDIIKIIYSEAKKIGEEGKIKVTFKMLDDEDSFKVIVESVTMKYKGTVIYPYNLVKAADFEYSLDPVLGKITLYNKKEDCKKISVTIDGVALDIFSMTYSKAKNFLKEISDRKTKNGYIEFPDAICFKIFGVKLNAKKEENGDISVDAPILSIDVYNEEEFFKEYYFEEVVEKEEEKYDVNIPLPDEYNYEKKESKKAASNKLPKQEKKQEEKIEEKQETEVSSPKVEEIQIEIPVESIEQNNQEEKAEEINLDDADAELDRIRKRQDEELEKVKEKLRIELEQQLQNNLKKYDEENEKRVSQDVVNEAVEEIEVEEVKVEVEDTAKPVEVKEEPKQEEIKPQVEEKKEEKSEEPKEVKETKEDKTQDEIKELERLLEEERKQQEVLENRILKKLEELKEASVKKEKTKVEPTVKNVKKNDKPQVENKMSSYTIESYKGIKETDKKDLAIFFGEDKTLIRNYLGNPTEQREDEDMEIYDKFFVYYNEENRCTGMGIYNQESYKDKLELKLFDQNLVTMKYIDIVKLIKAHDYSAIEDEDGIISLKYGISIDPKDTSNYKEELCDVIYIFKKEYYN